VGKAGVILMVETIDDQRRNRKLISSNTHRPIPNHKIDVFRIADVRGVAKNAAAFFRFPF
jgi:hypothetical protein